MRRPRVTKILDVGDVFTYVYVKKDQPMVLKITNMTGDVQWLYWETYLAENVA